eukprot:scaffold8.g1545.t1
MLSSVSSAVSPLEPPVPPSTYISLLAPPLVRATPQGRLHTMATMRVLLLVPLALGLASLPSHAARTLNEKLYCCSAARPCWGWGPNDGKCCADPSGGDCVGATPCSSGATPDSFSTLCGASGTATADQAAGTNASADAATSGVTQAAKAKADAAKADAAAAAAAAAAATAAEQPVQQSAASGHAAEAAALRAEAAATEATDPAAAAAWSAQADALDGGAGGAAAVATQAATASSSKKAAAAAAAAAAAVQQTAKATAAATEDSTAAAAEDSTAAAAEDSTAAAAEDSTAAAAEDSSGGGGGTWTNVAINRYGSYANFGQGQNWMGVVSCTGRMAPPGGLWAAMNYRAFGLPSLPCGMHLVVSKGGRSVTVTVVDGGGSDGLDLDDDAYGAVAPGGDGMVGGFTVTAA